jgi:putative membrane-bound dehydrogenase-like protein
MGLFFRLRSLLKVCSAVLLAGTLASSTSRGAESAKLSVLMLGDHGHHRPAELARLLTPILGKAGIAVTYTPAVAALTPARLARYDVVLIFRDSGDLPADNEAALLQFVEGGKGLVAVHCASHCFRNSARYTSLVGGRFLRHGTAVFKARVVDAQHPALVGFHSFASWDETYVHNQLGDDLRVLMVRDDPAGAEPYTWVRHQGKGRVFYTALGHDERTWKAEGFQNLLDRAIRWAAGRVGERKDLKPFKYVEANVPNYLPGRSWGTIGEPIRRMQLPLEPAESIKHLHLPEGFEVRLFAAEPDIVKPIAVAWDERGRAWVAETVDYPNNLQPQGKGHDRIIICEDTDGDGRADKFTVFADKLSIPTSMVHANGGLIVAQAPHMLFLKDTKGTGRADVRKVLFTGFGTADTHSGPSNLRLGLDNWVYATVGYSGFRGVVGGKRHRFGQGLFRFRPDGSELEFLASSSNNTWGLGLGETGEVFYSTANGEHSAFLAVPNRVFEAVRGWAGRGTARMADHRRIHPITTIRQVDFHGGFTAAAGHALYTARQFPREFWDRIALVCEPTGHLVHMCVLEKRGSGYVSHDGYNLLASEDEWTAPIAAEVGPDGAVWVLDWYNFIVQHNPTPQGFQTGKGNAYKTPLRDKKHGRIYRIVHTGGAASRRTSLAGASARELVAALKDDNLFWRMKAQRALIERGRRDVFRPLARLVADRHTDATGENLAAVHALWTLHGLGAFNFSNHENSLLIDQALAHPAAGVRRAAIEVAPRGPDAAASILRAGVLKDADPVVRRTALVILAEMPASKETAAAVLPVLDDPRNGTDRWIPLAAMAAAARNDIDFLQAAAGARPRAETEQTLARVVRVVAGHLARRAPPEAGERLLTVLATARPFVAEALLDGLAAGWPEDRPPRLGARTDAALTAVASKLSPDGVLQLASLAGRWGLKDKLKDLTGRIRKTMVASLQNRNLDEDDRLAAARNLVSLGTDADIIAAVLGQITPQATPTFTRGLLQALGESSDEAVGSALVKAWTELSPAARAAGLTVLLRRPAWTRALLAGLEQGQIDKDELAFDLVQLLTRHPDKAIADRATRVLAKGGRLPSPDRQKVLDTLLPLAKLRGDKAAGKAVFEKNCAKCHRFGNLGQVVGPDLTGIAVRDRAEILIDILDPNRSVEGNYRQYTIETKKGTVLAGLLAAETRTTVELLDQEGKRHVVLREDIDSLTSSKLSLMPEGFEKLPKEELVSLLEFLTARGKYFPLPLGKAATITSVRGMFYSRDSQAERLVFRTWGHQEFGGVPFQVIDPRGGTISNIILLRGPLGPVSRAMPRSVSVPCNAPAKTIHLLSGVSGWGYPYSPKGTVSLIVRLRYADGKTEDHPLVNGVHFADYIQVVDVPGSKLAFRLRGQQIRYLAITPKRAARIEQIDFVKGTDNTAPVVMAVTVEGRE